MNEQQWKLVPVKPTEKMLADAMEAAIDEPTKRTGRQASVMYSAFIKAAPQPNFKMQIHVNLKEDGTCQAHKIQAAIDFSRSIQQPALGGEPEVVGYRCRQSETENWTMSTIPAYWEHKPVVLLDDHRAHVTQLQALTEQLAGGEIANLQETRHANAVLTAEMQTLQADVERLNRKCQNADLALAAQTANRDAAIARAAALEGRLRKAIAFVQGMRDAAGSQPSVATGYLKDILDELSSSEGAKS